MPILNFTMFVDKIVSGKKRQTIRKLRKRPIKVGDKLYLYTGMRTKDAKNLCQTMKNSLPLISLENKYYVICKEVHDIRIYTTMQEFKGLNRSYLICRDHIELDNKLLSIEECEELAKADGFESFTEMVEWFDKMYSEKCKLLDFTGQLIKW